MKFTKASVATLAGFVASSMLLILVADCSFDKVPIDNSAGKQTEEFPIEQQTEAGLVDEQAEQKFVVANPFCTVCHYGFEWVDLALSHKLAGIGCERCHGESERHRSDENNVTPPEIMYPKAKINPTCMMCHPRDEINHIKDHKPLLAGAKTVFDTEDVSQKVYCTGCHAKGHRINVRTIRWNKATGELLK